MADPTPPEIAPETSPDVEYASVTGRIKKGSAAGYILFAGWALFRPGWWPLVGLTCAALVNIIGFLWLEDILGKVLHASPHPNASKLGAWVVARFVLLGAALSVSIFVARFDALSVVLGFSVVVVGIFGEALYSLRRALRDMPD